MYNTGMLDSTCLPISFYDRPVLTVARELLGMHLVRELEGNYLSGVIVETEAYDGQQDLACHARVGKTERNRVMFGPPGHAYVYFTYGMHWCLNAVTGPQGYAAAVLIRAIYPVLGKSLVADRRAGVDERNWTNGPAKLTRAFGIDKAQNGASLFDKHDELWIAQGEVISDRWITIGPRVGIDRTPEPWRSMPWRFRVPDISEWSRSAGMA